MNKTLVVPVIYAIGALAISFSIGKMVGLSVAEKHFIDILDKEHNHLMMEMIDEIKKNRSDKFAQRIIEHYEMKKDDAE